jgi:hypothetical protein
MLHAASVSVCETASQVEPTAISQAISQTACAAHAQYTKKYRGQMEVILRNLL